MAAVNAQTASEKIVMPLKYGDKRLNIFGLKKPVIENTDGGIKISCRNDDSYLWHAVITYTFEKPVKAESVSFDFSQTQVGELAAGGELETGVKIRQTLPNEGPAFTNYLVEFAAAASDSGESFDNTPIKSVIIFFSVPPYLGDCVIEIKNWSVQ
ncbi:hypothetical protein DB345_05865 [Spartobacteria bacterium LR76]|nr:hypothetical protein DB345_05865 [Spartobacteria bacterium LR76]